MYDYYEYKDEATGALLAFKFRKGEKALIEKIAFNKLLGKAAMELSNEIVVAQQGNRTMSGVGMNEAKATERDH